MTTVEYYFTLISPWTFLGDSLLRDIAATHGARVRHVPVNMGRVFKATGGVPLAERPEARKALRLQELERWRSYRGLPLNLHPAYFPVSDKLAAGVVVAAQETGADVGPLAHAFMNAVWVEERNISDPEVVQAIVEAQGFDAKFLMARAATPDIEQAWERNTDEAISKGVMGAPFYIVGEHKFWGQDRLDFVDRLLGAGG